MGTIKRITLYQLVLSGILIDIDETDGEHYYFDDTSDSDEVLKWDRSKRNALDHERRVENKVTKIARRKRDEQRDRQEKEQAKAKSAEQPSKSKSKSKAKEIVPIKRTTRVHKLQTAPQQPKAPLPKPLNGQM